MKYLKLVLILFDLICKIINVNDNNLELPSCTTLSWNKVIEVTSIPLNNKERNLEV